MSGSNVYIEDARRFFRLCEPLVREDSTDDQTLQAVTLFALGVERVLKGILWNVNPTYVYVEPSFKNTARLIYAKQIVAPASELKKNLAAEPDEHVIAFSESLARCKVFSVAVRQTSAQLHALNAYRDVIAHRPLSELPAHEKLREWIWRSFAPVVARLGLEITGVEAGLFSSTDTYFDLTFAERLRAQKENLRERLAHHRAVWEARKDSPGAVQTAVDDLVAALRDRDNNRQVECPACGNPAYVHLALEYVVGGDPEEAEIFGHYVERFKCTYCGFATDDPYDLDALGLGDTSAFDAPFFT